MHVNISAVVGRDSVLPCLGVKDLQVDSLEWTCDGKVLLVYRKGSVKDGYEHPIYTNQVQLMDPLLHGGDFSLRLMDVAIEDTGVYECFFVYTDERGVWADSRFIHLTVTEQDQDTTPMLMRKHYGLIFGVTLAVIIIVIGALFALPNSSYVKLFKKFNFNFCVEEKRPRKHLSSCSTTLSSESSVSTKALIHGDVPIKADLAPLHWPVLEPTPRPILDPPPPFSPPLPPSSSPTSSLNRRSLDYGVFATELEMKKTIDVLHKSCPDMCVV